MTQVAEPLGPSLTVTIPKWALLASVGVLMTSVAPAVLFMAMHTHPTELTHDVALFGHLACLVVGFGAVLSVDWMALLWTIRRRTLVDVLSTATNVQVPIWAGYAGLVITGLFLEPNVDVFRTQIKLAMVLVIGLNGLFAMWLHLHLQTRPHRRVLAASVACAFLSQIAWWTATVIGFITSR